MKRVVVAFLLLAVLLTACGQVVEETSSDLSIDSELNEIDNMDLDFEEDLSDAEFDSLMEDLDSL